VTATQATYFGSTLPAVIGCDGRIAYIGPLNQALEKVAHLVKETK